MIYDTLLMFFSFVSHFGKTKSVKSVIKSVIKNEIPMSVYTIFVITDLF